MSRWPRHYWKAVAVCGLFLVGCASLIGQGANDKVRIGAGYAFDAYANLYQPLLKAYSKLPYCAEPAAPPCRDRALYKKLYDLDGAVVACAGSAQKSLASSSPDLFAITSCLQRVEEAKFAFASAGVKTQ